MNPSASSDCKWKINELRSMIPNEASKNHVIPFIAVTESWLKPYISDAQINIPNYSPTRKDRDKRKGGGVVLFSHESLPITDSFLFGDELCQSVFCRFDTVKMAVAVVYRPPDSTVNSFKTVLRFLEECIANIDDDSFQIQILGDFNFPTVDWESHVVHPHESRDSALELLRFMSDNLMNQYVHILTRGDNTLDLFITNNPYLVTM